MRRKYRIDIEFDETKVRKVRQLLLKTTLQIRRFSRLARPIPPLRLPD
jgi:hypothetical protein